MAGRNPGPHADLQQVDGFIRQVVPPSGHLNRTFYGAIDHFVRQYVSPIIPLVELSIARSACQMFRQLPEARRRFAIGTGLGARRGDGLERGEQDPAIRDVRDCLTV
jgi:hypothetical protein